MDQERNKYKMHHIVQQQVKECGWWGEGGNGEMKIR